MPRREEEAAAAVVPLPEQFAGACIETIEMAVPCAEYEPSVGQRRTPLRLPAAVIVPPQQPAAAQVDLAYGTGSQPYI